MGMDGRSHGGEEQKTYRMEFPKGGAKDCPVEGCPRSLRPHNDGDWADAKRAEEGASDVWGLWARDGGGITGFPPHDTAWEGKGERMDMDRCNNRRGRTQDI